MRIRGVGVIDDAVLELSPGLNVLTGETGAGKTMVVSGLGLLLGERADSGLVRTGCRLGPRRGRRAARRSGTRPSTRAERGRSRARRGELVLARTIAAAGRSRAHVGGRTAPVGVLAELGETLVAVHGQADQWRLRQGEAHREVLDEFGGRAVTAALRAYRDERFDALARRDAPSTTDSRPRPASAPARSTRSRPALERDRGDRPAARRGRRAPRRGRAARPCGQPAAGGRPGARLPRRRDEYASEPPRPVADDLSGRRGPRCLR